jgi:hypothetical protein
MNVAKGLDAETNALFGDVQVLMFSGLQQSSIPVERFTESPEFLPALSCDFSRLISTSTRIGNHAPRGQSPSLDRSLDERCAPPARSQGPAKRARPRGRKTQTSSICSQSPPTSEASSIAQSRTRRSVPTPDLTTIYLNALDADSSDDENIDDRDDPDFTARISRKSHSPRQSRGKTPQRVRKSTPRRRRLSTHSVPQSTAPRKTAKDTSSDESVTTEVDPDYVPTSTPRKGTPRSRSNVPRSIKNKWQRQKYQMAVRAGTFKSAKGRLDPHAVAYKNFGFIGNEECSECGALFFEGEGIKSKELPGFLQCCRHGKVHFDAPDIPEEYAQLLNKNNNKRKEFLQHIRTYNNYFALAAFQAKFAKFEMNFPHVIKLHGQVRVLLHPAEPQNYVPGKEAPQRIMQGQCFFVDPADAQKNRDAFAPNQVLDPDTVLKLDAILRKFNKLYKSYERMATLLEKAKREWERDNPGERPPNLKMVFKRRANDTARIKFRAKGDTFDTYRLEEPVEGGVGEVAVVYDTPHRPVDAAVWVQQKGKPVRLGPRNELREPLLYPLLYPTGEAHWYSEMGHRRDQTGVHNKVTLRQYYSFILHLRKKGYLQKMLGTLTQQWIVEGWVRVEDSDINYLKNLDCLRISTRPKLTAFLEDLAEREGMDLGRELKLPASFSHSPAQMQRNYMNAIQMVRVSTICFTFS